MRLKNDQYFTPPGDVYPILPFCAPELLGNGYIVEPSCGTGHVINCLRNVGVPAHRIIGLELDPDLVLQNTHPYVYRADTLATRFPVGHFGSVGCTLIIGNPPYDHATEFVEWGMQTLSPGGRLLYLLRLDFAGSLGRAPLFRATNPALRIIPRRCSFVRMRKRNKAGKYVVQTTDQHVYAWFDIVKPAPRIIPHVAPARENVWLDQDPDSVAIEISSAGLQVPYDLWGRYRAPLVDEDGTVIEAAQMVLAA